MQTAIKVPSNLASIASVFMVMLLSKYSMAGLIRSSRIVMDTAFKQEEIELGETKRFHCIRILGVAR